MPATSAIALGRLGRTRIYAHPSMLVAGGVLVVLFAPRFDYGDANPYLVGVVFVLALYVSILVHELAHAGLARAFGMAVPSITLNLLGGVTHLAGRSRGAGADALTALVGPVASAAVGLLAFALAAPASDPTTLQVLWALGWINLLVAGFNLLPGPPLDGGHVLASVVEGLTGRRSTGVVVAAWTGRATAVVLVVGVVSFSLGTTRGLFDILVALLVGAMLWSGAGRSLRHDAQVRQDDTDRSSG